MPGSQIKRAPEISSNFIDSNILNIVRAPYDFKTFCLSSHKSNGHRRAVLSGNAVRALFISERHRSATGRTSGGDRMATVGTSVALRAVVKLPFNRRTIYTIICYQPFIKKQTFQLNRFEF